MWHLVADSSCDLFTLEPSQQYDFQTVPFSIRIGHEEYIDTADISVEEMLTANENHQEAAQTACPSPEDWVGFFSAPGPVLAFTISSALSGSYNSACAARAMVLEEEPEKEIAVIDTRATGAETVILIRRACEMIEAGMSFQEVVDALHQIAEKTHTIFALSSYHNLIKAGRVIRLIGFIAGHLGFWGIGVGTDEGEIAIRGKARGTRSMIRFLVEEIKKTGVAGKEIFINHCQNPEAAQELKKQLLSAFHGVAVNILPTRGLDSFYAERHGLIIGY